MRIGIDVGILREERRGVGHYLKNLLENFSRLTNDFFYLYSPRPIREALSLPPNFFQRFDHSRIPGSFWLQIKWRDLIKRDRIETFFAPAHILPLGLPKKIKKVLVIHDLVALFYPETMAHYNLFVHKLFFRQSVKEADILITMANSTKRDILKLFSLPNEKVKVIYEGVDEKFRPAPKAAIEAIRQTYQLKRPFILSCGTLEPRKNYPILLEAFSRLKENYDLVIVGKKGWKYKEVFEKIKELNRKERIKVLGYVGQEEIPPLYSASEFFVFPSLYEGFGLPVLEAMACGAAVISSNAASLPEVGGDAVLYFNPKSSEELLAQMERLIRDEDLRAELKRKGIERAKRFTWEKTAQETLSVLKS